MNWWKPAASSKVNLCFGLLNKHLLPDWQRVLCHICVYARLPLSYLSTRQNDASGAPLPPPSPPVLYSQTLLALRLLLLHRVCI